MNIKVILFEVILMGLIPGCSLEGPPIYVYTSGGHTMIDISSVCCISPHTNKQYERFENYRKEGFCIMGYRDDHILRVIMQE